MHTSAIGRLPDDLIDTAEAARLLKTRLVIVYRWILSGRLPGWKRGGRYFVSKADCLERFQPVSNEKIRLKAAERTRKPTKREQQQQTAYERWREDVLRRAGIVRDDEGGQAS